MHQQNTNLKKYFFNSSTIYAGVLHWYFYINIDSKYARRKLIEFSTIAFYIIWHFYIFIALLP